MENSYFNMIQLKYLKYLSNIEISCADKCVLCLKQLFQPNMMLLAYNLRDSGGRGRRILSSKSLGLHSETFYLS